MIDQAAYESAFEQQLTSLQDEAARRARNQATVATGGQAAMALGQALLPLGPAGLIAGGVLALGGLVLQGVAASNAEKVPSPEEAQALIQTRALADTLDIPEGVAKYINQLSNEPDLLLDIEMFLSRNPYPEAVDAVQYMLEHVKNTAQTNRQNAQSAAKAQEKHLKATIAAVAELKQGEKVMTRRIYAVTAATCTVILGLTAWQLRKSP